MLSTNTMAYKQLFTNDFALKAYKPSYILPFYYTYSPAYSIYKHRIPNQRALEHAEVKYQISLQTPILGILDKKLIFSAAYTQLAYWQFYISKNQYFRSIDQEPELFLTIMHFFRKRDQLRFGIVHQSNGKGDIMERSWNRFYAEYIIHWKKLTASIKVWHLLYKSRSSEIHNPDITQYMGHGRLLLTYALPHQGKLTLMIRNPSRQYITWKTTFSFPMGKSIFRGFVQFFSGYGQSLLEYKHRTHAFGLGLEILI